MYFKKKPGPVDAGAAADKRLELLRDALERSEKKRRESYTKECPIGLDDNPDLCSAGICLTCLFNRIEGLKAQRDTLDETIEELIDIAVEVAKEQDDADK